MHRHDLNTGVAYTDGKGNIRRILSFGDFPLYPGQQDRDCVRYRLLAKQRGPQRVGTLYTCTAASFATWAKEEAVIPLHAYTNDTDTFIAASLVDVQWLEEELYGTGYFDADDYRELLPDMSLTIRVEHDSGVVVPVTKTVQAWIADNGRGLLCSTEF